MAGTIRSGPSFVAVLLGVVGTALALLVLAASAHGATITVNNIGDGASDDGTCTLREAITATNGNAPSGAMPGECDAGDLLPTVDTIAFNITGPGPHKIQPAALLPFLNQSVAIDGTSGGNIEAIELDGSLLASGLPVLITGGGTSDHRIDAISVYGATGTGTPEIDIGNSADVVVENSFIGTDSFGTESIGGTGPGITIGPFSDRTIVRDSTLSGNGAFGLNIIGNSGVEDVIVTGNRMA